MKGMARGGVHGARGLVPVAEYGLELMDMPAGARIYDTERSERMLRDGASGGGKAAASGPPVVMNNIRVINQTGEPVRAKMQQTPEGIDVILAPIIRNEVTAMAARQPGQGQRFGTEGEDALTSCGQCLGSSAWGNCLPRGFFVGASKLISYQPAIV